MKKFTQKATLLSLILMSGISYAQDAKADSAYVREHYEKTEQLIPMRDGTKLFTAIYFWHKIVLNRTFNITF